MRVRHDLATLWEHTYLMLSHIRPTTVHGNTSTCLLCRHRYVSRAQRSPSFHQFVASKRYPSENELVSTEDFQPKIYACLVRSAIARVQVEYALSQLHYVRIRAPIERAKNALLVLDDYSTLPSAATLTQSSWRTCRNLVVLGLNSDAVAWTHFVTGARATLSTRPGLTDRALFLLLQDARHLKNFLAWMCESGGRISPRTLVNNNYLAFDVWTRIGETAWNIPFFV